MNLISASAASLPNLFISSEYVNFHVELPTVWRGVWNASVDGVYETRASVTASGDGFLPTLEISQRGGDCDPNYGDPLPTRGQAMRAALGNERAWHRAAELADLDAAGLLF